MKPYVHAKISAKRHGGVPEDYLEIHDFFDESKKTFAMPQHRAILHNTFGVYLVEKLFGHNITNSDGKEVSVREIAEEHVFDDLGFIPTVQDWLKDLELKPWMQGKKNAPRKKRVFKTVD